MVDEVGGSAAEGTFIAQPKDQRATLHSRINIIHQRGRASRSMHDTSRTSHLSTVNCVSMILICIYTTATTTQQQTREEMSRLPT
jgi:hypothetical protein